MRSSLASLGVAILLALAIGGCSQQAPETELAALEPAEVPDIYRVRLETNKGDVLIEVHREWAPRGADQFHYLVSNKFYDGARFYRVVRNFVAQFGINPEPKVQAIYGQMTIRDDPVVESNRKGFVSFAQLGDDSRTTQVFINLSDNTSLDKDGYAPFGEVVEGMENVERLWNSYGEMAPRGSGPDPTEIEREGEPYLAREFPRLDTIIHATIVPVENASEAAPLSDE